jgi:hypothetical protein
MAGVLQHLRSSTLNKRPNPASMVDGQVAINYASGSPGMFFKDSNGALVKVGPVHVGSGAPNAVPASGGTAGNSLGEQWLDTSGGTYVFKIWDGSAWRSEAGEFVNITGDTMTGALGIIAGSASSPSLFFSGDTNTGIYSPGADQVAISTNGTGRLFVDASGRVGVGAAPTSLFSIRGNQPVINIDEELNTSSKIAFRPAILSYADTGGLSINYSSGEQRLFTGSSGAGYFQTFYTDGSERMRLDSSGRLGLGSSNPGTYAEAPDFVIERSGNAGITVRSGSSNYGALYFADGTTGDEKYRGGITYYHNYAGIVDQLRLSTAGAVGLTIDSSQRVGIGTTSPATVLDVATTGGRVQLYPAVNVTGTRILSVNTAGSAAVPIEINATQILFTNASNTPVGQFDTSGRLLVGTSTASKNADRVTGNKIALVGVGAAQYPSHVITGYSDGNNDAGPLIELQKSRGASDGSMTAVVSGDRLGSLQFLGSDGTNFLRGASIASYVDNGADGTALTGSEMPCRLVFSVTQDGSASPTGRMRISNDGNHFFYSDGGGVLTLGSSKASGTTDFLLIGTSGATGFNTGTNRFFVFTNGNVQNSNNSYGAISDIKLKESIVDANSQWDDLKALQVRNYNFKSETGYDTHTQIGLIAQEVELVSPGLVSETPDRDAEGNDLGTVTKSVNYSVLYMKAVKALQEAMERIETLEAKVAALEAV